MDKIKELTDFYMWMQENNYDHNIRARVEIKAEMYLNNINVGQKLPIYNVSNRDLYKELRAIGLTHDTCDEVLDWIKTLHG